MSCLQVSRAGSERLAEDVMAEEPTAQQALCSTGSSGSSIAPKPALVAQPRASLGEEQRERLSFANGMNDRLYEQLSAKLLYVDDKDRMLTVSAAHSGQPLSSRQAGSSQISSDHRKSHSAGPSPRQVTLMLHASCFEHLVKHWVCITARHVLPQHSHLELCMDV
jgi:hypothetical protein